MLDAGLPLVAFLQLVRVYGQALAQIADAEVKLFHLYVHEPMIRDGAPVLEIAEELSDLASRAAAADRRRSWTRVHQRLLQHFLEQDVVGHLELRRRRRRARPRARGDRVRRPRRLHAADRGGGRGGGARGRRALRRAASSETLPDDARVIKTIGDEVMVVGTDAVGARRLGGRLPGARRPSARCRGSACTRAASLYRDGDYYGRAVNLAARVGARATGGEVLVTREVDEAAGPPPRVPARSARSS